MATHRSQKLARRTLKFIRRSLKLARRPERAVRRSQKLTRRLERVARRSQKLARRSERAARRSQKLARRSERVARRVERTGFPASHQVRDANRSIRTPKLRGVYLPFAACRSREAFAWRSSSAFVAANSTRTSGGRRSASVHKSRVLTPTTGKSRHSLR